MGGGGGGQRYDDSFDELKIFQTQKSLGKKSNRSKYDDFKAIR
jgi:hypothetical protein